MENLALSWLANHQQFFVGIATGWATAHVPQIVALAFHAAMKIPWLRAAVVADPVRARALVDQIRDEIDKDITDEAAKGATPPPPAPGK